MHVVQHQVIIDFKKKCFGDEHWKSRYCQSNMFVIRIQVKSLKVNFV